MSASSGTYTSWVQQHTGARAYDPNVTVVKLEQADSEHISLQESHEIVMHLLPMIPFPDISAIQLLCWDKEVALSGASHIVAMEMAGDDSLEAGSGNLFSLSHLANIGSFLS